MTRGRTTRGQREASDFTSLEEMLAPQTQSWVIRSPFVPSSNWQEIEDRRLFDPEQAFRPALSFDGTQAQARAIPRNDKTWSTVGFNDPSFAVICARRHQRREVLFAKRKTRRGRGGSRRRNWYSDVRC